MSPQRLSKALGWAGAILWCAGLLVAGGALLGLLLGLYTRIPALLVWLAALLLIIDGLFWVITFIHLARRIRGRRGR